MKRPPGENWLSLGLLAVVLAAAIVAVAAGLYVLADEPVVTGDPATGARQPRALLAGAIGGALTLTLGLALLAVYRNRRAALYEQLLAASEAKRRLEQHYRILFEQNPLPMWVYDRETLRFLAVNTAAEGCYGFSHEEFLAMTVDEIVHPSDRQRLADLLASLPETPSTTGPWKHRTRRGESLEMELSSDAIDFEGRHARLVLAQEVSGRLREQQALENRARQNEALAEIGQRALAAIEIGTFLEEAAQAATRTLQAPLCGLWQPGSTESRLRLAAGCGWDGGILERTGKEIAADVLLPCAEAGRDGYVDALHALEVFRAHGVDRTLAVQLQGQGQPSGVLTVHYRADDAMTPDAAGFLQSVGVVMSQAIQRAEATAALRRSEELLRIAGQAARIGGWSFEVADCRVTLSEEVCRILGVPHSQTLPVEEVLGYLAPEHREPVREALGDCTRNGMPFDLESEAISAEQRRIWLRIVGKAERDENGRVSRVQGAIQELSERKRLEAETERLNRSRALILESAGEGICAIDREGRCGLINSAGARILGFERDELVGRDWAATVWGAAGAEAGGGQPDRTLREVLNDGVAREGIEDRFRRRDASTIPVVCSLNPIQEHGEITGAVITFRDTSAEQRAEAERRTLEEQLNQARKMDAVGQLAGGVAHDFNNMLGVIQGYVEMSLEDLESPDALRENLEEIRDAATRSTELTRQLLAFARRQPVSPEVIDINTTVETMLKMLTRLIGEDIELAWEPAQNLLHVNMDPSQVHQIVANLAVNARDAIDGGGRIQISTHQTFGREEQGVLEHGDGGDAYVCLAVADDGRGMDAETRSRIFEPFFTTKTSGGRTGVGLGLATVYGIVKQNRGHIEVDSAPDEGTEVRVYLPAYLGATKPSAGAASPQEIPGGSETVLVVEDELALLKLSRHLLEGLGYTVLTANDPRDALDQFKSYPGNINLLITDVIMPGMNGRELADRLLSLDPSLRCMFVSGYTADNIAQHGVLDDDTVFLQKPFTRKALARKVRAALETQPE